MYTYIFSIEIFLPNVKNEKTQQKYKNCKEFKFKKFV